MAHTIERTRTSAKSMRPATVNSQVAAALMMHAYSFSDPQDRNSAMEKLENLMRSLREATLQDMKCRAFGSPGRRQEKSEREVLPACKQC